MGVLSALLVIYLSWISAYSCSRSGYILTFPQELQLGAEEKFCLSLFNSTSDVSLTLNISCYGKHKTHTPVLFGNGEDGCFTWLLPDSLPTGQCELTVQGSSNTTGYKFGESREITVLDNHQITFIQTDRPFYRPGQLVRARILTITQDLKPLNSPIESISIHDPHDFQMMEWSQPTVKNGFGSMEYQLYNEPVLGDWTITTTINGRKTSQTFSVLEYVLPKFEVNLKLPSMLTVATKSLEFEVCARYTYGKPVDGTFNATVCLNNKLQSWFCQQNIRPCFNMHSQLQGCKKFVVESDLLNVTSRTYSLLCKPRIHLVVNVTEKNTGLTVSKAESGVRVLEERVKLEFLSRKYFKPYFPYYGKIKVTYPDGRPVAGERIIVEIGKLHIDDVLVSDQYGFVNFTVLNITHSTDFFFVNAKTEDVWENDHKRYTIYPAKLKKLVKQWYSPSLSYMTVSSGVHRSLKCGESVSLEAVYSLLPDTVVEHAYYQIISKGNIISKEVITESFKQSSHYLPEPKGKVLQNSMVQSLLKEEGILDQTEFFDISGPQGPPGWSAQAAQGWGRPPAAANDDFNGHSTDSSSSDDGDFDFETEVPQLRHFPLKLHITRDMFAIVRVLVYFVTGEGEMVADTLDFDVEPCTGNKVEMNFSDRAPRPGSNITVSISATPGSLCSMSMVDKSVYLHGGNNLLLMSSVTDRLKSYDLSSDFIMDWQYCSVTSDPPQVLSPVGPPMSPGMQPVEDWDSLGTDRLRRKKRSLRHFYSNMYDSLLAFKVAGLIVMTDLDLQTRPCLNDGQYLGPPVTPGDPRGPVPGQGGPELPLDFTEDPDQNADEVVTTTRDYFPETWLWDLVQIPTSGQITLQETLPYTVTQWLGNAYCSSSASGIGVSETVSLTSFQPFFLSVSLPYSVVRGEVVTMVVTVFNYLPHCTALKVSLLESKNFEIFPTKEDGTSFCICADQSKSVEFSVNPKTLGSLNVTVTAFLREHRATCRSTVPPRGYRNKQSSDTVVRQMLVKAEGIEEERTQSHYICPQDFESSYNKTIEPDISVENIVQDSLRGWIGVIGDVMGPSLSGVEDLVALPTGCGEQNMVKLAPNIAVLRYLTATNQLSADLEAKIQDYLYQGFQQQLTYMHSDGGYSAFGTADDYSSTWLSAFVFKTFRQALEFIYVDRKQIQTRTWEFLITKQGEDGCFDEDGKVLGKYMQGGVVSSKESKRRALTAYILVAMLESFKMMKEKTPPFIALAVKCIEVENLTDIYTLALTTYAMTLYKPTSTFTHALIQRLKHTAVIEDDLMYWQRDTTSTTRQHSTPSAEIEITSYALLALLTRDKYAPINNVMPIVRWLTKQRNAYGGFTSTQDTVVGLQALALFAERVYGRGLDVTVNIESVVGERVDFLVTRHNRLRLQQHVLKHPDSQLQVTANGEGCILLQTTYRYNILTKVLPESGFYISITTPVTRDILDNNCRSRDLIVCTRFVCEPSHEKTNNLSFGPGPTLTSLYSNRSRYTGPDQASAMSVVQVNMVSGWIPDVSSLRSLINSSDIAVKRYDIDWKQPDHLNFYFDQISSEELCFAFSVVLETRVTNQQPALAKVFEYYESSLEATCLYELSECSEEALVVPDNNLADTDLYLESPDLENHTTLTLDQATVQTESELGENDAPHGADVAPAPRLDPACPLCVTTGTVNVLQDICLKQVWTLEVTGQELSIHVVASDSISPGITVPVPVLLENCRDCKELVGKGQKNLMFLDVVDWSDLTSNIIQSETVILPWTLPLQQLVQETLKHCPS